MPKTGGTQGSVSLLSHEQVAPSLGRVGLAWGKQVPPAPTRPRSLEPGLTCVFCLIFFIFLIS